MIKKSSDSKNQFLQSKSSRNNYSHSIQYTNTSKIKQTYCNIIKSTPKKVVSQKLELMTDDKLIKSYNKNANIIYNNYITSSVNKSKIINRSSNNFPNIILTKRGIKQITNKIYDSSIDYDKKKSYQNKTDIYYSRKDKKGYYSIYINEEKKLSSSLLFSDNIINNNEKEKKEKAKYRRRNTYKNEKIDNNDKDIKLENYKDNSKRYNIYYSNSRRKSQPNLNNKIAMNKIRNNTNNCNNISIQNTSIYDNDFSKNNKYSKKKVDKNEDNNDSIIKNKTFKKEEIRQEYKIANSILTKKKNTILYEDFSNIKTAKKNTQKYIHKNHRKINLKESNHILFESKYLKNNKSSDNFGQKGFKVKIIDTDENKSGGNILNLKNTYTKIIKVSKLEKCDKENTLEDKKGVKRNIITSVNIEKNVTKSERYKENNNLTLLVSNDIKNNNENISKNNISNHNIKYNLKNSNKNNESGIKNIKYYEQKNTKNNNSSLNNKENLDRNIVIEKQFNKQEDNSRDNDKDVVKKEKEPIETTQNKQLNTVEEKDNKLCNKNNFALEINKSIEVTFNGKKTINNTIFQNNTSNSNIIIVINSQEQKKALDESPDIIKNDKNQIIFVNNILSNFQKNNNLENDNNINKNKKEKNDNNDFKKKKIIKKVNKPDTKIKRKALKNIYINKDNQNNNNIIINTFPKENIINGIKLNKINDLENNNINKTSSEIKKKDSYLIKKDINNTDSNINKNNNNIVIQDKKEIKEEKKINRNLNNENVKDNKKLETKNDIIKEEKIEKMDNNIKNKIPENCIKNNINITTNITNETQKHQDVATNLQGHENRMSETLDEDDFPKDSIPKPETQELNLSKNLNPKIPESSNSEIPFDKDKPHLNNPNSPKNEIDAFSNFNNFLSKKEPKNPLSPQKKFDLKQEEIQELKPALQHNVKRKRPVFTLPSVKTRSMNQQKPFHLINKYYDENFILEDDEEIGFKYYIYSDDDSLNEPKDNISKKGLDNSMTNNNINKENI